MNLFRNPTRAAIALGLVLWCGFPSWGNCCEPILPLVQLLSGATLAGPGILTKSLFWLFAAIAIKCVTFAFFERRLPFVRAVLFMLLANVVSTIPGLFIAVFFGSGPMGSVLFTLPIFFALGWMVQRRLALLPAEARPLQISGGSAMLIFVGLYIASIFLYIKAHELLSGRNYEAYWLFKFLFVTLVACTGIVISAVLEESVVSDLARKSKGSLYFYTPVFRANYVTLGVILLVSAITMLPKRFHAPHFIVTWLHTLMTSLGWS